MDADPLLRQIKFLAGLCLVVHDNAVAGKQSLERIVWTDDVSAHFLKAQQSLSECKTITLPRSDDQLWIVTDSSVFKPGLGATLYVSFNNRLLLAGFLVLNYESIKSHG